MKTLVMTALFLVSFLAQAENLGRLLQFKAYNPSHAVDSDGVPLTGAQIIASGPTTFFDFFNSASVLKNNTSVVVVSMMSNGQNRRVGKILCRTPDLALRVVNALKSGRIKSIALPYTDAWVGPEDAYLEKVAGLPNSLVQAASSLAMQSEGGVD